MTFSSKFSPVDYLPGVLPNRYHFKAEWSVAGGEIGRSIAHLPLWKLFSELPPLFCAEPLLSKGVEPASYPGSALLAIRLGTRFVYIQRSRYTH